MLVYAYVSHVHSWTHIVILWDKIRNPMDKVVQDWNPYFLDLEDYLNAS